MDSSTIFIVASLMMFLNGGVLGLIHKNLSPEVQPSASDWRIGTLLAAGGSLLLAFQKQYPTELILPLANGFLATAIVLYARSIRRFFGELDVRWMWLIVPVCVLGIYFFSALKPSLSARVVLVSLMWSIPLAFALKSLVSPTREIALLSGRVLAAMFATSLAFMLWRVIYFSLYDVPESNVLSSANVMIMLSQALISILPTIGTTAFALMCTERAQRQWQTSASVDHLTGIANRFSLTQALNQRFTDAQKNKSLFALMIVDIDHFKSVNDKLGHGVGDRALVHVAHTMRRTLPASHVVGRQGGDEFVVLLATSEPTQAKQLAEQVRVAVERTPLPLRDNEFLPLTVSIGVTCMHPADGDTDTLLRRADHALYLVKNAGRNRVEIDHPAP